MKLDLHCEAYYLRSFLTKTESEALYQNLIDNKEIIQPFALELYEHALPLNPEYKQPRINLTFRKFGFGN